MKIPPVKVYFPEEDREDILEKISETLNTGYLTLGKYTEEFEKMFAEYIGTEYAVAVNSGTAALEIILRSIGIKGRSVIVPTNTFFATPASVIHAGGKVVFSEISGNLCMSPMHLLDNINNDTKAVILVHIGGNITSEINEIQEICEDHELYLIEDAAHAHGATIDGMKAGNLGDAGAFSFYPTKVMTTGEGGMITTNDKRIYEKALILRDQGKARYNNNIHVELGYAWRMNEINAILGLSQLRHLDEFLNDRRRIANFYDRRLRSFNCLDSIQISRSVKSSYYKYVVLLESGIDRDSIKKELKDEYNVSLTGEVYEVPCHKQPIANKINGFKNNVFPVAEDLCKRHICLPIFATMTIEEAQYVIDSLKEVVR